MQTESPWPKPSHVRPECLCPSHVFEDTQNGPITALLSQGNIPFIIVSGSSVEVMSSKAGAEMMTEFVAISHVRSQGLGNWSTNALPWCQLSRLQDLVNRTQPPRRHPTPFWIDTACIPLTKPGKAIALETSGSVFRGAAAVLALDVSLRGSDASSAKENLLKIRSSTWAKRLWTVQEGALARSLRIQFRDTAVDLDGMIEDYSTIDDESLMSWTVHANTIKGLSVNKEGNFAFINLLLLFERDLRAALGKVPPTRTSFKELESAITMDDQQQLHAILRQCYLSTERYRFISSVSGRDYYKRLRAKVEQIYIGISYNDLSRQQELSLAETLNRLEEMRTMRRVSDLCIEGC